jgi:hypothetical protein
MFFRNRHKRQTPGESSHPKRSARLHQRRADRSGPFTRDDLDLILDVHALSGEFEAFVMHRFGVYTNTVEVRDTTADKPVPPVESFATYGGAEYWQVQPNWLDVLTRTLKDPTTEPFIPVQHYVAGDRGPGKIDFRVHVPLAFIFADPA